MISLCLEQELTRKQKVGIGLGAGAAAAGTYKLSQMTPEEIRSKTAEATGVVKKTLEPVTSRLKAAKEGITGEGTVSKLMRQAKGYLNPSGQ